MTVTGAGFDSSHVVKLDGSDVCKTQSVSLTNIICVVPAVSVGIVALARYTDRLVNKTNK